VIMYYLENLDFIYTDFLKERDYSLCIDDNIFGRPTKDLLHKSLIEEPRVNLPQNCHTNHCTRH
jgi:hypothetical protein